MSKKEELRDIVPVEFYRGDSGKPYADSVGMLISELKRLPADMPIQQGSGFGCILTVYNISDDAFLEIEEADDDDD